LHELVTLPLLSRLPPQVDLIQLEEDNATRRQIPGVSRSRDDDGDRRAALLLLRRTRVLLLAEEGDEGKNEREGRRQEQISA